MRGLVPLLVQEESLKVLIFESADPDFFIVHYDTSRATQSSGKAGPTGCPPWLDFVLRLGKAPIVSIAKVKGRARGVGNDTGRCLSHRLSWPGPCSTKPAPHQYLSTIDPTASVCFH